MQPENAKRLEKTVGVLALCRPKRFMNSVREKTAKTDSLSQLINALELKERFRDSTAFTATGTDYYEATLDSPTSIDYDIK